MQPRTLLTESQLRPFDDMHTVQKRMRRCPNTAAEWDAQQISSVSRTQGVAAYPSSGYEPSAHMMGPPPSRCTGEKNWRPMLWGGPPAGAGWDELGHGRVPAMDGKMPAHMPSRSTAPSLHWLQRQTASIAAWLQ